VKIHHLGVAVRSLAEAAAFYRDVLGLAVSGEEDVSAEGVRVAFLPAGGPRIELLEPLGPDSPIARFLAKRGEGLHHVCFEVPDLEEAVARLTASGAEIIPPPIRVGAGGRRIAFIHPRSAHGLLVELKEAAGP
jgi:methylmalonyl-CoA epimerase